MSRREFMALLAAGSVSSVCPTVVRPRPAKLTLDVLEAHREVVRQLLLRDSDRFLNQWLVPAIEASIKRNAARSAGR
jgi:hypothetical protein